MLDPRRSHVGVSALALIVLMGGCGSGPSTQSPVVSPAASRGAAATAAASTTAAASPKATVCSQGYPGQSYSVDVCLVAAPSLAGNLLGDPTWLDVSILTPSDYAASGIRYPVVYFLTGFGAGSDNFDGYFLNAPPPGPGKARPIIVVASGTNSLGGSYYANSSVTGNWEDAISKDLVGYVDGHYRTIAKAASRGLAGHSMGGFGTIYVGLRHPELFSAIWAESPGIFSKDDLDNLTFPTSTTDPALALDAHIAGMTQTDAVEAIKTAASEHPLQLGGLDLQALLAIGAAFAPDPKSVRLMLPFPFKVVDGQTVRDDALGAKWRVGFDLDAQVRSYISNPVHLKDIALDWGAQDQWATIPRGCEYLAGLLEANGIEVTTHAFDGDHVDQLSDRLPNDLLPYMIDRLATS